ncbi:MAG: S-layer homology domain-containing protein [Eubacteriales bacterium]
MNNFKKILTPTLAALMVAASGTMVFAKNYDDVASDHPVRTEISILSDIGVIKGTSESEFSPEDNVTREQMATLLFRLMLGRDDAGRVNTTKFTDLYEPYYNGAISWANSAGYIIGTSETTFNPTGGIKKQDAMAMLVRALGQDNEKMNAGYPWSYINAAVKLGLDKGLENVGYEETLTRAETAQILYNALTSEYLVGRTTNNGNIYYESTSIIEEVFGYNMAEATLVATNDYSIDGEPVVKKGYVTLLCEADGKNFYMTTPYAGMNLDGDANDHLGMSFKVIYKVANNKYEVLSAVDETVVQEFDSVKIDKNNVIIGDNKYTLVEEYSDELSTNNNELKLFAYDSDNKLEQITDVDDLSKLLGFYRVTLMFDGGEEVATRGIIRVFEMDKLNITSDGKYNIAGGKKADELNITNNVKAEDGDYVLYYYNPETAELEIAKVLDIDYGTVKRITNTSVKIGDMVYNLGNETAGITAESLRNKLTLGSNAAVVVYNNTVVAVVDGVTASDSSRYLLSVTDAYRVYENGSFKYVMTAFIDGEEKNIYVDNANAKGGEVFRYTESGGVYTLISPTVEDGIIISGKREFIQKSGDIDEIAYIIEKADGTSIELSGRNYYTLNRGSADAVSSVAGLDGIKFVCDKNSVIIVNDGGKLMMRSGAYSSTIEVKDGANVTAVFDNEIGSVETLKYLYISDGSLGNYDLDAGFVRILDTVGQVFENGVSYTEYLVYNFSTGKIENMLSKSSDLVHGEDYRCGNDDTITSDKADAVVGGFVTGFTSGTVSVDGYTFTLASDIKVIRFTDDNKIEDVKLSDLYMKNIEFVAERGTIKLIIEAGEAKFTAEADDKTITVKPDFDLGNFNDSKISSVSITKGSEVIETSEISAAKSENNTIVFTLEDDKALENGEYTITFRLGSKTFEVNFTVDVKAPAEPETPETPETPENPENPENPEYPETPENPETPETPENPDNTDGE